MHVQAQLYNNNKKNPLNLIFFERVNIHSDLSIKKCKIRSHEISRHIYLLGSNFWKNKLSSLNFSYVVKTYTFASHSKNSYAVYIYKCITETHETLEHVITYCFLNISQIPTKFECIFKLGYMENLNVLFSFSVKYIVILRNFDIVVR